LRSFYLRYLKNKKPRKGIIRFGVRIGHNFCGNTQSYLMDWCATFCGSSAVGPPMFHGGGTCGFASSPHGELAFFTSFSIIK